MLRILYFKFLIYLSGMRKIYLSLFALLLTSSLIKAQAPTWSSDIAYIMYESCTRCHSPNGVGPFEIMSYQDAYDKRFIIQNYVNAGIMPPWPPDPNYTHFALERALSDTEIQAINDWVNAGAPEGNAAAAPPAPWYPSLILGPGDSKMQIPTYTSQAQSDDDYVCFAVDPDISVTKILKSLEVVPGNRAAVHHVLIYAVDANAGYTPGQAYPGCTGPGGGRLLGGYAPGSGPQLFPDAGTKMGIPLADDDVIVLAMHYPQGSFGQVDSTYVNFHYYPDGTSGVREVFANPLIESWNFVLPPNQETTLAFDYPQFGVLLDSFSILSIFPHNHLLGKSWLVYAVGPNSDTIPLISIPKWDFDWQGFYFFDYIKKIPAYYRIHCEAVYDNTTANPWNPNNPPQLVFPGLNTSDEMFLCYLHYLPYEPGDENIHMASILTAPVSVDERADEDDLSLVAYPNPFRAFTTVEYVVKTKGEVSIEIYDLQGKMVRNIWKGNQGKGTYRALWYGNNSQGQPVTEGYYIARVKVGDQVQNIRLLKME